MTLAAQTERPETGAAPPRLSVIVPCFNEASVLPPLLKRTTAAVDTLTGSSYEILLVDDGSTDDTLAHIRQFAAKDPHITGIALSRNFGHQAAVSAGLTLARGDRILLLDADLQDPPELVADMMALMDEGADVVYGQRLSREGENLHKTASAGIFYRLLRRLSDIDIPADTGDFRLMSRQVVNALNAMPEQNKFIRGMVSWVGFRQVALPYHREKRAAGDSHYPLRRMISLALDAITGFSVRPLRMISVLGIVSCALSVLMVFYALGAWIFLDTVSGWTSLTILISFFSGIHFLAIGILGEYIGRIFLETKNRPPFIIASIETGGGRAETGPGKGPA